VNSGASGLAQPHGISVGTAGTLLGLGYNGLGLGDHGIGCDGDDVG